MREDISKVVTERPRAGGGIKTPKGSKKEFQDTLWEDQPKREKIRQKWTKNYTETKDFTNVLGPLYGYLLKQVGRPWDKVYSEIRKQLKPTSMQNIHILGHIDDIVETNVIMKGKVPCHAEGGRFYGDPIGSFSRRYETLYVDPNTGILRRLKPKKNVQKKPEPKFIKISETEVAKKIKDIWYSITIKKASVFDFEREYTYKSQRKNIASYTYRYFVSFTDRIINKEIRGAFDLVDEYGMVCRAIEKRQMGKREIKKKLGL
jgi:hypothetical protein